MDTAAMLQHIESLVREHVGTAAETQATKTEPSVKSMPVQHPVERMRGGVSSSPIATFAATERTPKHESRAVALPLPRRVHRDGDAPIVATVQLTVVSGSKEEPIVLDDEDGVSVYPRASKDIPDRSKEYVSQTVAGEPSDVVMSDAAPSTDSTYAFIAPAATTSQDLGPAQNTNNTPILTETSTGVVEVETEDVEPLVVQPSKQDGSAHVLDDTLPGDTSEEDEPLSVVLKAKRANAIKDEQRPVIRINLKRHRSASNMLSETTSSGTPLRIRIPSFRKSSPPRTPIPMMPSEPTSPSASSSPPSPNLPTSTAETPWDSDLSDLTPIEDSSDEGESEVDESEPAGDAEEERPKVSTLLDLRHAY